MTLEEEVLEKKKAYLNRECRLCRKHWDTGEDLVPKANCTPIMKLVARSVNKILTSQAS
ncbi:TPA: hypothetical protein ACH3X2_008170 [Trebouxia sp. C0005]